MKSKLLLLLLLLLSRPALAQTSVTIDANGNVRNRYVRFDETAHELYVNGVKITAAAQTDARPPLAHAASHASGGSDPLTLTQSQITGLVTALSGKSDTSHTHTGATISNVDISEDTNLAVTTNEITLTGDTLSLHAAITRDSELDTSAELRGIIGDENGDGVILFNRAVAPIFIDLATVESSGVPAFTLNKTGTTALGRMFFIGGGNFLSQNVSFTGSVFNLDDTSKTGWLVGLNSTADLFQITRFPAGANPVTGVNLLVVEDDGTATFAGPIIAPSFTGDGAALTNVTHAADWNTAAEINAATTDDDFLTLAGTQSVTGLKTFTNGITLGTSGNLFGGTNLVEQRNSTNAQIFRAYNTYTDASNYERGFVQWVGNQFQIGTEQVGTGTARAMNIGQTGNFTVLKGSYIRFFFGATEAWNVSTAGHFVTPTDNTYDIGAVGGTRPRNLYLGTSFNTSSGVFRGATSGTTTVSAPAVAGAAVITWPSTTGTLALQSEIKTTLNFGARMTSAQTIAVNNITKLSMDIADTDPGAAYSTANKRWTPRAGPVLIQVNALATAFNAADAYSLMIVKNGVTASPIAQDIFVSASTVMKSRCSVIDTANGTDYYEIFLNNPTGNASSVTINHAAANTSWSGAALP